MIELIAEWFSSLGLGDLLDVVKVAIAIVRLRRERKASQKRDEKNAKKPDNRSDD